jgi:DNA invertase Pin-like site-specific DNA recombinase
MHPSSYRRTVIYTRTSEELEQDLRRKVEALGGIVVAASADHVAEDRHKRRNSGWRSMLANLDGVDQIAMASAGDLPGKTVKDLLRLLATLRDHGVGLLLMDEGIDTGNGSAFTVLDIVEAFRRAKLSQAIRRGQAKALAAGKIIGRPEVPSSIRHRIQAAIASGGGIWPTARRYGVSPASVINIRRSMAQSMAEAA